MNKYIALLLLCLAASVSVTGCGNMNVEETEGVGITQIANPWSQWSSIQEAEEAVGFSFGIPEVIADKYTADKISTMNNELIQVTYLYEDFEVCVRKIKGEEQDISGDYNEYESCQEEDYNGGTVTSYYNANNNAVKIIVSYQGYSWSLVMPNGYDGDYYEDFLNQIIQ